MKAINYFPIVNQGITMKMSGKIDSKRLYVTVTNFHLAPMSLFPVFKKKAEIKYIMGEYLLLTVDGEPDYNIITSLN